ncbi:6-phosphogluconolactonase [Thalassoporum mexicanum PCC 7367]|uniref:6-phosphogluconolactonase n=1 Tax=Thalassoporum mexicanum TaxID=3457544 RepID=UPI00029FEC76|nr:6-phosphogluconolactonase [Pseudanabaena sp. PCC 7367]AFY71108.1 6-phosphogluconolactonase [Pseudanabaena sp. PCC 7367]
MGVNIEVFDDRQALIARALEIVLQNYKKAIETNDRFTFAASGGSTPKPLYAALAEQDLDWHKFHVFWGDERYVPPSDPQSNEGMTRQLWLDQVAIPASNIHAMPTTKADPALAAITYSKHLQDFFKVAAGDFPAFDLILLGLGDDGHTASLFPHTEALKVGDRLVTVGEKDGQLRLTFTAPLINAAKQILFLVEGSGKAEAVAAVNAKQGDSNLYPARLVQGNVNWVIDQAAAANL